MPADPLWGDSAPGTRVAGISGPGYGLFAVSPSDTVDLVIPARALYITVGGTLSGIGVDGIAFGPITFPNNFLLPVGISRVKSTGTAATGLFGIR